MIRNEQINATYLFKIYNLTPWKNKPTNTYSSQ